MRRRLLLLFGVLLFLFTAPGLPPVRNALLRWGASLAARTGYTVSYDESSGNLFYRVNLEGLRIQGPGAAIEVESARLGYTLPALLTGRLPLRTEISGVRGTLDIARAAQTPAAAPGTPAAARQGWFRPVLEQAEVSDVTLKVSGVPFDVPDVTLTRLEAEQTGDTITFRTALAARAARLNASGTVALAPFELDATVERADVALARSFFDGARGGTLSGTVQADAHDVTADLTLEGGRVDLAGLELTEVSGPLTVRDRKLTTELTGQALGGSLAGTGTVDFGARQWQADVTGNAALGDALFWVGQGQLPEGVIDNVFNDVLEPSGSADVRLSVGGWRTFTLAGQATGRGSLLGRPLRDLDVDFGFESGVGNDVTATATLGGAPFRFALTPRAEGFGLTANGQNLPLSSLSEGLSADVNVDLETRQGTLSGTTDLTLAGRVLGRNVTVRADAEANGRGWQVDLSGSGGRGAQLSGALELQGNRLDGTVRVTRLTLPGLTDPVIVTARADGPLSDLPLTLQVSGLRGVHPVAGGVQAEADFSGSASATLKNGVLTGVRGDFGPLDVSGTLDKLSYMLSPTALSGRASGNLEVRNGQLTRQEGQFSATAQLVTDDLQGAGVTLPDLNATVDVTQQGGLTASVTDERAGVDVNLQNGNLGGTLSGTRIGALGETFATSGTVTGRAAQLGDSLELDLNAATAGNGPKTTLRAVGNAQNTTLSVRSERGATLAGRTLGRPLALSGNASLTARSADLSGTLGTVDVSVEAAPAASGRLRTQASLGGEKDDFTARFDSLRSWSTDGTLPLGELGQTFGLPLRGTVQTTLSRQGDNFSGQATLAGTAFGLPLEARATTQNDRLTVNASARVLGEPLTLSGTALPETDVTLQSEYGAVDVQGRYPALTLNGSGQVPGVSQAGLELSAQPWQLSGNLAQGRADLQVGASQIVARRGEDGWTLEAGLEQRATLRGEPLVLSAELTRNPQNPAGRVRGTLALGGVPLTLTGTLQNLRLTGTVPAATVQPGLLGRFDLEAQLDTLAQAYELRSSWRQGDTEALSLNATGTRGELTATVQGNGLEAALDTTTGEPEWTVAAADVALRQFPVAALQRRQLGARLSGSLSSGPGGYSGRLSFTAGNITAQLRGQGKRLGLSATAGQGELTVTADGTLEPDLNLAFQAAAPQTTVQGSLGGTLTQPTLSARAQTTAQSLGGGQFTLPAQQVGLEAALAGGLTVSLGSDTFDVQLQNGVWDGTIDLPFTLRNAPHRLTGTVQGRLTEPVLDASLSGETVQGPLTLSRSGLTGDLALSPDLGALPDAEIRVSVAAAPDLSWRVGLEGDATLPYRNLPATLRGRVMGRGVRYEGAAALNVAGEEVPLELSGEAGRVQARAAFSEVDLSTFAPVTGTLSGDVRLLTDAADTGLRYFADLQGEGRAAGRAFDLTLNADRSSGVELSGTIAGATVSAAGALPLETLEVQISNSESPLEVSAVLALGETLTLQGEGGWQGEPLALAGTYTPRGGNDNLRLLLGDALLTGNAATTPEGRVFSATVAAPTGLLSLPTSLNASARIDQSDQGTELSAFRAQFGQNTLSLSGTVPGTVPGAGETQAALTGTLSVPAAGDPIALRLSALETGYLASLTQNDLVLRSVLSPALSPERVRLIGTLQRPEVKLQSDLVWQAGTGFSGRADAILGDAGSGQTQAAATLTLLGQEQLKVQGAVAYREVQVATLAADLSADPRRNRELAGTLSISAPAQQLSPVWPGDPLSLGGALTLSGTLSAPRLEGPLSLQGALSANGSFEATRQGAELSLTGDGLLAAAAVDTEGYRTTLTLTNLNLGGLAPQLGRASPAQALTQDPSQTSSQTPAQGSTLSGVLRATQSWGDAPTAQLSEIRLEAGRSRLTGQGRLGTGLSGSIGLSGSLELDAYLSDVAPGWQGRVAGPVFVSPAAPLSGTLSLRGVGPKTVDWRLGGNIDLSGDVTNPAFALALRGQGSADGTLQATLEPLAGRLELTSTLGLLGVDTDFTLARTNGSLSAAGTLGYGDFRTVLETQGGQVQLRGRGNLTSWRGTVGPEQFSLRGPLTSLNPQLTGTLALGGASDLSTLRGTLTRAAFGPVTVGDVAFSRNSGGLEFRGEALNARVGLSAALPWTLGSLRLELPGSSTLTLSGEGTRTQGQVTGEIAAAALTLPLSARYAPEGLELNAQGTIPAGVLGVQARYRERWRGQLNLTDGATGEPLVTGRLTGSLTTPALTGDLELTQGGTNAKGSFQVNREALQLNAQLTSPQLTAPLNVTGRGWPLTLQLASAGAGTDQNGLRVALREGRLEPTGALAVGLGSARLELRAGGAENRRLVLQLGVPAAPGLALRTTLPAAPGDYAALLSGVTFRGAEQTSGTLTLSTRPTLRLNARALNWRTSAGSLTLSGEGVLNEGLEAELTGRWRGGETAPVPWLREAVVPFRLQADGERLHLTSESELGQLGAVYRVAEGDLTLQSDLQLGRGQLSAEVAYTRAEGPTGTVKAAAVPVFRFREETGIVTARLDLGSAGVAGEGTLELVGGQLSVSGSAGWLQLLPGALERLTPAGTETLAAQLRLSRFDLGGLPQLATRLPNLSAPVSGVATISNTQIVGQLIAPELRVLAAELPTQVDFNGTLAALEARATVGDSRLNVRYSRTEAGPNTGANLAGLVTLEGFPLQALPEAVVGASQLEATVTGAARFDVPLRRPVAGYVRVATERLTLRSTGPDSTGKTTRGDVALRFENGSLFVERAEFRGDGFWQAQGVLTPENLDFTLEAQNADFTPLLRLVPQFAAFNVGAQGSLDLQASGSASAPDIALQSPQLELSVAGGRYRAVDTRASLSGGAFGLSGELLGVAPITGRLELSGSGQINLAPFATNGLALRFDGGATVPALGAVTGVQGRIYPSENGWQLDSSGVLGRPFRVSGGLAPLELNVTGQALDIQARPLFVASSSTDVDLQLATGNGIFTVSGDVFARRAQLSLDRGLDQNDAATAASSETPSETVAVPETSASGTPAPSTRENSGAASAPAAGSSLANESRTSLDGASLDTAVLDGAVLDGAALDRTVLDGTSGTTDPAIASISSAVRQPTNPVFARIRFSDVSIEAPREVLFNEAFGSAELGLDLILSGTAAQPRLDGQAQTLDGSIRFSGQDFSLVRAVATFDPTRGAFPTLELDATASFDKSRALGSVQSIQIVEPATPSFDVLLQITGGFETGLTGRRALDLAPELTSNALIQEEGSSSPRPLTEAELVSLLTLGRLQLGTSVVGGNSLAGTVAESALDTAVDLLLVSELQNALNEVIGTDLLEIRTSAFSSVLGAEGSQQNFGVSVKVGGYLSDNLFASVQVGRYDDPDQAYALSNEFLLRYTAAPLELNFSGGVNFLEGQGALSAVTDFSLGLSYAITPLISLDASLDNAAQNQSTSIGFGVSFTW